MNRILALCLLTLSVASAQTACESSLFTTLPTLQPLYTSYKTGDWKVFELGMETFIKSAQQIVDHCLGIKISSSSESQLCLQDVFVLARLAAPLAVRLNDSEALTNLVNNFEGALTSAYKTCLTKRDDGFLASEEFYSFKADGVKISQKPLANSKDVFSCLSDVYKITPLFLTFIQDVEAKKGYDIISDDLKAIFSNVDQLCDDCGLPKPHGGGGPVDIQTCLLDASKLADDIHLIVDGKDISSIFQGLYAFIQDAPQTLTDCGILSETD